MAAVTLLFQGLLTSIKFLDNKIASDQMLAEKRRCVVTISSCYVYVNTTSEVKIYLGKIRQLAKNLPEVPISDWVSGLFF